MGFIVKVTRRGRITLPSEYREKLGIKEGDKLLIEEVEWKLLVCRIPDLLDLTGVDSGYGTVEEAKKMIERMRREY
ncbi:MAG: AbrB/MazE/SpoVT family DNA-binding domain-containing protein [Candidatus Bathyarchaeia archaeon]